jgi:tellurite resistance protein TehA-like permease
LIGVSVVLWAFGTWWIPLLVLFGIWRYLLRGYPRAYEPGLWNVVFPLGMFTVACWSLGHAARGLNFMSSIARFWFWVGLGAWIIVFVLMAAALLRAVHHRSAISTGRA